MLTPEKLRDLADEARVTTETIARRLLRIDVRGYAGERADEVLRRHGLIPLPDAPTKERRAS